MLRDPVKIQKATRSVRVTEEIVGQLEISAGARPELGSLARVTYNTIGRVPILITQPIRLEVNSENIGEAITCRQLYALLKAVPDMVSEEEKSIDFKASVSQEEEVQQENGPSVDTSAPSASAPAESTTVVVDLAEGPIPDPPKPSSARTIGPKRGPRSLGASSGGSKGPGSRGRPLMNLELDEGLASALQEKDLQGFTPLLVKARMTSMRYLCLHTVEQLEEALKKVGGNKFQFSTIDRGLWMSFGLKPASVNEDGRTSPAARMSAAQALTAFASAASALDKDDTLLPPGVDFESPPTVEEDGVMAHGLCLPVNWRSVSGHAATLLGNVPFKEFSLDVLQRIHARLAGIEDGIDDVPTSISEAVSAIDVELAVGQSRGYWTLKDIRPPLAGIDEAVKRSRMLVKQGLDARYKNLKPSTTSTPPTSSYGSEEVLANSIIAAAAMSKPLSDKDAKIAEELDAAKERFETVAADESLIAKMERLAAAVSPSSGTTAPQRLAELAEASNDEFEIAQLLHAAHVRPPDAGKATAARTRLLAAWRATRQGIQSALGDVLKDILPADAVVKDLCKAVLDGHLYDSTDPLKVKKILNVESPPDWLGGSDVAWDSSRSKQGKELIQLNQAFSIIAMALALMHPTDTSVMVTMTAIQAEIAKGCRTMTAEATMTGILVPILREMDDRWAIFQKSSSAQMPTVQQCWHHVRQGRVVTSFFLQASQAAAAPAAAPAGKETVSKGHMRDLENKLKALSKKVGALTDDEGEEEDDSSSGGKGGKGGKGSKSWKKGGKKGNGTPAAPTPVDAASG